MITDTSFECAHHWLMFGAEHTCWIYVESSDDLHNHVCCCGEVLFVEEEKPKAKKKRRRK